MSDPQTSSAAESAVTPLKVSGHLMALEPGLYCVFNGPGTAPPDAQSGLPGVRISAAPGQGRFPGTVALSGFAGDGWLGGEGAALVRVSGGPAQVMVTVYQALDSVQDAPRLQVLRLNAPVTTAAAAPVEVAAHVYGRGDVPGRLDEWVGERGSRRWIEGFGVNPGAIPLADLEYQAVLGRGWMSPWQEGGQFCGSRGMSLPILGLRLRLRGASAQTHALSVSATFVDGASVGPVEDGVCEAPSLAALEAFRVSIVPKAVSEPRRRGRRA